MSTYTVKVSSNGQVSIPSEVRRRWQVTHVLVIDKGGQVIIRPLPANPAASVIGKYAQALPPSEEVRRLARAEETEREARQ